MGISFSSFYCFIGNQTELDGEADDSLTLSFPKPSPTDAIKPELRVFRRGRQQMTVTHEEDPASALDSGGFLNVGKLVFIVHGFWNTGDEEWIQNMRDALVMAEDQTVVVVAWGGGANLGLFKYDQAASNTRTMGSWLAECAKKIKEKKPSIYLHGIGHSLGAHILGMAGRASGKFDRISGLDPASPNFGQGSKGYEDGLRGLCETDAITMVDVIHTDATQCGRFEPMGTIDFYPNYGYLQPSTASKIAEVAFSHERSHVLFTRSIGHKGKLKTKERFEVAPSGSKKNPKHKASTAAVEMGYYADAGGNIPTGLYYIKIKAKKAPWAH